MLLYISSDGTTRLVVGDFSMFLEAESGGQGFEWSR